MESKSKPESALKEKTSKKPPLASGSKSVTSYISAIPKATQPKFKEALGLIRKAAPKATEDIKWGNLAFSYNRILVIVGAFKKHIGFYPTPSAIKACEADIKKLGLKMARGSVQFPLDKPLPKALIAKLTKFRVKESKEEDRKWKESGGDKKPAAKNRNRK